MKKYILKYKILLRLTVIFKVTTSLMYVFIALLLQRIVDAVMSGDVDKFARLAIFIILYSLTLSFFEYLTGTTYAKYLQKTVSKLREDLFKGLFKKGYKDFSSHNTAEYISHLTNDISLVENNYINPIILMIGDIVMFIGTVIMLLYLNVWVTLSLFLTAMLMLVVPIIFSKLIDKSQLDLSNKLGAFTNIIKDMFSGYEVVKSYNLNKIINKEFNQKNIILSTYRFKSDNLRAFTDSISSFLAIACQITGLIISGFFILKGSLSIGSLVAVIQLGNGIHGPIMWIIQRITQINGMKSVNKKLIDMINTEDSSNNNLKEIVPFNHEIKIRNLNFGYESDKNVLKNINCTFKKNKKYAIIGESGCGKSTLIKLILGYYDNYNGSITIDNQEIKKVKYESLSKLLSIIHQNVYMFDSSIKNNILLWKEFDSEKIKIALEISGVNKFLYKLENGLEYSVGENGKNISGGEKQRIAIARSIIQNTPILVIDEGTSSLDNKTAYDIEDKLLDQEDLTIITITHKINKELLQRYDEIIVMDKGEIVEIDNYDNLSLRCVI